MSDLVKAKIEDVCDFVGGSQPPKEVFISEYQEGYIRLIQTRDYKTDNFLTYIPIDTAKRFCGKNDIIIGRYGPPVFQIFRGLEGSYNVALMKAVPKSNITNSYLYYFLKQEAIFEYVEKLSLRTGGQTGVDLYSLNKYPILLPNLCYQQKIAAVLSSLDSKIELNNKINAELEAMAKMLYDYWFVQFDFPDSDGKPYKTSGGKMVWNDELKREIPDGWEVNELKKYITIERGISYKGTDIKDFGIPMVNLNSFYLDGRYKDEGIKYFSGSVNGSKVIKAGDLMIATTDVTRNAYIIGKSFILPDLYEGQVVASCDIAKVCINDELNKYYLDMLFNSDDYHRYIKGFASGTLVLHLDTKGIDWYKAVIPSIDLLNKFADFKSNIDTKKTITLKENKTILELRDWLLPMLMNGQVGVVEKY